MYYLKVLVGDATYHGKEGLTYANNDLLPPGSLVTVPLRQKAVLGIVTDVVDRPTFSMKKILQASDLPILPSTTIKLLLWMKAYYPAPLGIITQLFLPKQLPKKNDKIEALLPQPLSQAPLPLLTPDQQKAIKNINGPGLHLLHGETGTGKTRVYIELAKKSFAKGKSVIILTPEIGLTSQLTRDVQTLFNRRVVLIHSQLSDRKRQEVWTALLGQSEPVVVVGPRSALFSPLQTVGLIIVDESHETAYKQDQAPYYHASHVAAKLAQLHQATLVLGSATPLVSDYYIAQSKHRPIIRMTQIAATTSNKNPEVSIVDIRDRKQFTKSPYLSDHLIKEIQATLSLKEQVLLFLNRRGTARIVFCEHCGWQAACPHCDLPLVYHGDTHRMQCHTCSYKAPSPSSCRECGNASIIFKSVGTKAITEEVSKLFPEAKIQRFDTDNTRAERIESHYESVHSGKVQIIIGTQTLAKGLDLPALGLVGVIIADTSLYFPDFSAKERTYQLLCQVIGRIGRGHRHGKAVVQTYNPESAILKNVLERNWDDFYTQELTERRTFLFPPFCHLLKLTCRRSNSKTAASAAEKLATQLSVLYPRGIIEGPAPSFHEKQGDKYQWQLVVKTKNREELLQIVSSLPANWSYDVDPMNLL